MHGECIKCNSSYAYSCFLDVNRNMFGVLDGRTIPVSCVERVDPVKLHMLQPR